MHKEILTVEQSRLLSLLRRFSKDFFLVGGTAIALHIGHRRSIDFDLFTSKEFDNVKIRKEIVRSRKIDRVLRDETGQYTMIILGVRLTFFHYPFSIRASEDLGGVIKLPDLLTLAAMKAYALGRRAKWKDYVDLYFIFQKYSLKEIVQRASGIYGKEFGEKLLREQLSYYKDVDYSERVMYKTGYSVADTVIRERLTEISLS